MERTKGKFRLCLTLIAVNIVIIWGNSLLPGSVSGAISAWVRDLLAMLIPGGSEDPDSGHGLLRKLAHFAEFACLGGLLTWLFAMVRRSKTLALLCGVLVACADETIQRFVPDRGPSVIDVLIDTAGVVTGIGLLLAGYTVCRNQFWRIRKREKMDRIVACPDDGTVHDRLQTEEGTTSAGHHGGECQ